MTHLRRSAVARWVTCGLSIVGLCGAGREAFASDEGLKSPEPARHVLELGGGLRSDTVREDLVVPLGFTGPGLRGMFGYRGLLGPGQLTSRADLGIGFLWNRYGHLAATIDYGVLTTWTVPFWRARCFHVAAGPALALDSRVNYLNSWDDAHGYWLGSQWFGPSADIGMAVGPRWRLDAAGALALAGFTGRPPTYRYNKQDALTDLSFYVTRPHRREEPAALPQLQAVRLTAAFRHSAYRPNDLGTGWSFGADLRLARTSRPMLNVNLSAGVFATHAWSL